jgi:hypothetical protein
MLMQNDGEEYVLPLLQRQSGITSSPVIYHGLVTKVPLDVSCLTDDFNAGGRVVLLRNGRVPA